MRIKLIIICLLLSSSAAYAGDETLWPTMLRSLGDCVTPRISAPYNQAQEKANEIYCRTHNQNDPEKIKTCLENSRMETVDFFTDRCGETDGVYYISLNGIDYTLKRLTPPANLYAGKYQGDGISVVVKPGKLLSQEMTHTEEDSPAEIISEEYEARVLVTKGAHTTEIKGVFWQGR